MAEKTRAQFFPGTGPSFTYFDTGNIPNRQAFEDLLDSVYFKTEPTDNATISDTGPVQLATDANAKARTTDPYTVVQPHHLPLIMAGATEMDYGVAAANYQGLSYEVVDGDVAGRASFKITFNPYALAAATPNAADSVIIMDADDTNLPKRCTIAQLMTYSGVNYWQRVATTISPVNDNDNLDMGTGDLMGGDILLDNAANRTIWVDETPAGNGTRLYLRGGSGLALGGNTWVGAGDASQVGGVGGDLYLFGGYGTTRGKVIFYDPTGGGGGSVDKVLFGTTTPSTSFVTIAGGMEISGAIKPTGLSVDAMVSPLAINASGVITKRTKAEALTDFFGAPSQGNIIVYDSGAWGVLAPPSAEKYLKISVANALSWADTPAADGKVKVDAGATADYLGATKTDGSLRVGINGGLSYADGGNYITLGLDGNDLAVATRYERGSSVVMVDSAGLSKKIDFAYLSAALGSGWLALMPGTDVNATPASTSRIATLINLTDLIAVGMPLRFKMSGESTYRYAMVSAINASQIDIQGEPLISPGTITELYFGHSNKVINKTYFVNVADYNSVSTEMLLNAKQNLSQGDRWTYGDAKCVRIDHIHKVDDATINPLVNARVGAPGETSKYVCTANTNKGKQVTTSWVNSGVEVDPTVNDVAYGENIELKLDKNSGTGGADYLTVNLTFILI